AAAATWTSTPWPRWTPSPYRRVPRGHGRGLTPAMARKATVYVLDLQGFSGGQGRAGHGSTTSGRGSRGRSRDQLARPFQPCPGSDPGRVCRRQGRAVAARPEKAADRPDHGDEQRDRRRLEHDRAAELLVGERRQ